MKQFDGKILNIMLCSTCNTCCKHCYISYKGDFTEEKSNEVIANFKGDKITLNGTEPMLFPKYLKYFKQVGQDYVFTNTKIITKNPAILDELQKNGITKICFSYHYKLQELVSDISLKQVEDCIKLCQQKGFKIRLLCSVCKTNYKHIKEFCEKTINLGVKEVQFTNFIVQGNAIKNNLHHLALNEDEILKVLNEINNLRKTFTKDQLFIDRCGSFGNAIGSKNYVCDAGINDVTITPDLKLYPCLFFAGIKEYEIGFYKDGKFWITKDCKHNCNNCLAKQIYNQKLKQEQVFKNS